jgi:hypothetical protein
MTTARAMLETPHAVEHQASVRRQFLRGSKPKDLIKWFVTNWQAEFPDALNTPGVFVGRPDRESTRRDASLWARDSQPADLVGGSHLGSPRVPEKTRRFLEDSPLRTDQDGYYENPFRAAVWRVAGQPGSTGKYPFMARWLRDLAMDGDWRRVARDWERLVQPEIAEVYTEAVLLHLWHRFQEAQEGSY